MLDDDVLGLDVSVDDLEGVQITDSLANLLNYVRGSILRKPSFFFENLIELPR